MKDTVNINLLPTDWISKSDTFQQNTLITSVESPIYIKSIKDSGFDWGYIPTLIALITTVILVYDRVKKSKLFARIISVVFSPTAKLNVNGIEKEPIELKGQQYLLKLSLSAMRKNFTFNDVQINVKYKKDKQKYRAEIFWIRPTSFIFDSGKKLTLSIDPKDFLWFNSTITTDKVSLVYITFIVDTDKSELFDELELVFSTPNGRTKRITTKQIDPMKALFENEIWIES